MDPEEIARREREREEKKKRKQERKLLKSQNKLLAGDSFHTPGGSESDSGVSQFTDSEQQSSNLTLHIELPASKSTGGHQTESSCDQTRHDFSQLQNHQNQRTTADSEQVSPGSTHSSSPGGPRSSALQKRNPFSVESLLSDTMPRRKSQLDFPSLPNQRTLVGKGHFLLYPVTHQPLGFLVPQAALKATPCQDSINRLSLGQRCVPSEGSPAPSDLCSFGNITKPLNSDHIQHDTQHHHNHVSSRADGADVEDCGGDCGDGRFPVSSPPNSSTQTARVRLSSTQSSDSGEERSPRVQLEVATNGCQSAELCAKEKGAREEQASPDLSECLKANTDCQETPGTDGEDVDMD